MSRPFHPQPSPHSIVARIREHSSRLSETQLSDLSELFEKMEEFCSEYIETRDIRKLAFHIKIVAKESIIPALNLATLVFASFGLEMLEAVAFLCCLLR